MNRSFGWRQISTGLLILLFICFIYAINSNNQTALIFSVLILTLYMLLESIWVIKTKEYKTVYWIAIVDIINIASIISLVILMIKSRNIVETDMQRAARLILLRDGLKIASCLSIFVRTILKSEIFKLQDWAHSSSLTIAARERGSRVRLRDAGSAECYKTAQL